MTRDEMIESLYNYLDGGDEVELFEALLAAIPTENLKPVAEKFGR